MIPRPAFEADLPLALLDVIPNPVLVKSAGLKYVLINTAFEELFDIRRGYVLGHQDADLFPDGQFAHRAEVEGRVLETGVIDEAHETIQVRLGETRETLTRTSRLVLPDGSAYLVGVMHDVTDVMRANADLAQSKAQLEEQARQLSILANTDTLTGALTRRALYDRAGPLMAVGDGHGLLLLDIDHFKRINDAHGHAAGDAALVHFCDTVRDNLRDTDVLARMGGEEFVAFLPGATSDEMEAIGHRIGAAVRSEPLRYGQRDIGMTVSIGGTWHSRSELPVPERLAELEAALADADRLLYRAKFEGRDRMVTS